MLNFILKRKITIGICVLLMVFGFGWWVWATTVGTDIDISGSLKMSGTEVISSAGKLQVGAMPTGGNWDISSDLTVESTTLFVGRTGGTYAGRVGVGTAMPAYNLDVTGDLRTSGDIIAASNAWGTCTTRAWDCADTQVCPDGTFMKEIGRGTTLTLCEGDDPNVKWLRMQIVCCQI